MKVNYGRLEKLNFDLIWLGLLFFFLATLDLIFFFEF